MTEGHFHPARAWVLDSEERLRELRPRELLKTAGGLERGMTGVDLGCGTGTFTLAMAEMVGKSGVVHAVDDSTEMLDHLRARNPPLNVKLIKADAASTGLASRMADCCLLAFILHEVKRPAALIGEACRLLKPGGRLVVLEWKAEEGTPGPPLKIRLSGAQARQLLEDAGLTGPAYLDWSRHHYVVTGRQV